MVVYIHMTYLRFISIYGIALEGDLQLDLPPEPVLPTPVTGNETCQFSLGEIFFFVLKLGWFCRTFGVSVSLLYDSLFLCFYL